MIFSLLQTPSYIIPALASLLIAFTIHEFSHALAAELLGDDTPKRMGRLTLNPLAHFDATGLILLMMAGFGWGKPVPYNPGNLKNHRWGSAIVGLAGPLSNLLLVVLSLLAMYVLGITGARQSLLDAFLQFLFLFNVMIMVFNLLPIPPLDGSKILFSLLPDKYNAFQVKFSIYGPIILISLVLMDAIFNLGFFQFIFGNVFWLIDKIIS